MRKRYYYKSQTMFNNAIGARPCDSKRVVDDPQLIVDVFENARMMDDKIRQWSLEDGINWILGFEAYVKDKNGTLTPKFNDSFNFKRGDIVLVDFFGHFGTELTYEHPAIVLMDTFDGVIIAPISTPCYNDGIDFHVSLDKNVPDLGSVKNNCGIKLEQSRFISKIRILKKFKRVSNTNKLNEIDDVLMQMLTPFSYTKLKEQQKKQEDLSKKLASQLATQEKKYEEFMVKLVDNAKDIEEKDSEIERLLRKIHRLEHPTLSDQPGESAS
jgi:mRNA-degrading endonuclease toxin of MazEF toxin-antitoxin module/uncharacterized coiled-coil protein SlyX